MLVLYLTGSIAAFLRSAHMGKVSAGNWSEFYTLEYDRAILLIRLSCRRFV
ncbi:hypothetical protein H9Q13_04355 [Pontibacter sp. JH31]|uniref:Uncharacterized protein n=1 Tax=Pontibacter aquaedesilientis TaxID=2766980 RepID=A0ABR7XG67_9BACT|nr:hypothetical protein [Pontibacter aquaedesilientis]MBD1396386.1 hypothetical protein [Pontibacter aquaedesilientis]